MNAVLEFETEYYTDWRCSICRTIRHRTYPARIVRIGTKQTIQCREHPPVGPAFLAGVFEDNCTCHCHTRSVCEECGK